MRRVVLSCLIAFVGAPAIAQNTEQVRLVERAMEKNYARLVGQYEDSFKHVTGSDSILAAHKAALHELEGRLRSIVGPFPVADFTQPGRMNNDDMFGADESFGRADGIRYQWPGSDIVTGYETVAVVTTETILRAWLQRRSGIDNTTPFDVAFAQTYALSRVFPFDAAAIPYAQIPKDTLKALGIPWGWIGNFQQDDCPCEAGHAVFMVERGDRIVLVALNLQNPIPPPPACLAELKKSGSGAPFRACYAREVVRDPRFGQIVAQIRELTNRIKRQ